MNEEKQRIAIAKACGWEQFSPDKDPDCWYQPGWRLVVKTKDLPDYLNDLNAMHEAEKVLRDGHTYWAFIAELDRIVKQGPHVDYVADRASATASQRAEAFLRTIGKWEEA